MLGIIKVKTATRKAQLIQVKMPQKSRNIVFRKKQTRNNKPSKTFRGFEVGKMVRVVFPKAKSKTKG